MTEPPQSREAEQGLLGALLTYYTPALLTMAKERVSDTDFYFRPHQIVYRAIVAVAGRGDHVDVLTVGRFLECHREGERSFLEVAGGEAMLHLLAGLASANGVRERAEIVAEDALWRRRLVDAHKALDAIGVRDEAGWLAATGGAEAPRLRVVA